MKILNSILILSFVFMAIGCSKDDNEVAVAPKSDAKAITSFSFNTGENATLAETVSTTVTEGSKTVSASVSNGTDVTALTPTIQVSAKASVSPSGAQDFRNPVTYTVTAEDGSTASYRASIMVMASDAKQIVSFVFTVDDNEGLSEDVGGEINETEKTITISVPSGADITNLTPRFEIPENASISPTGQQDFTNPVVYTVSAEDGSEVTYEVAVEVAISQKEVLIAIVNANPDFDLRWDLEDDIATLRGVEVDENGMVVNLNLQRGNVRILPEEIKYLTSLRQLNLSDCDTTNLPEVIGELINLTRLEVEDHNMTILPESIGNLVNLEYLNLEADFTNNREFGIAELPIGFFQLQNLTELYLRNNKLTNIPTEVSNLKGLTILDLDRNFITELPPSLVLLSELQALFVSENRLIAIPENINELSRLENLRLIGNDILSLPPSTGELSNLKILQIDNNEGILLPSELGNLQNLTSLTMVGTRLQEIPNWVFNLFNLRALRVGRNFISEISPNIVRLTNLVTLSISTNRLTALPNTLWSINSLQYLVVNENRLTSISSRIGDLANLQFLRCEDNRLTQIPSELGNLSNMDFLAFNNNKITTIPREVG